MAQPADPFGPPLTRTDRVALHAAYDNLMLLVTGCRREDVRGALLDLTPGKAAVASLVAFGAMVSAFGHPDNATVESDIAEILLSAVRATDYRPLPGDQEPTR